MTGKSALEMLEEKHKPKPKLVEATQDVSLKSLHVELQTVKTVLKQLLERQNVIETLLKRKLDIDVRQERRREKLDQQEGVLMDLLHAELEKKR